MLQIQSIEAKDPTDPVVLEEDLEAVTEVVLEEAVEVEAAEVEVLVAVEDLDPAVDSEVELEVVVSCQASYPDLNKKAVVVSLINVWTKYPVYNVNILNRWLWRWWSIRWRFWRSR